MPVTTPESLLPMYSDDKDHFKHILNHLFIPAIEKSKLYSIPPVFHGSDVIPGEIIKNLETADLVLCDISTLNPNVFFELGIRTALNKPISLVRDDMTPKIPFDTTIINHHTYRNALNPWELDEDINLLSIHINKSVKTSNKINSLWKYFGLASIAHPSEEKEGIEGQLEYLTLQMDSLKKSIEIQQKKTISEPPQQASNITKAMSELRYLTGVLGVKILEIQNYMGEEIGIKVFKDSINKFSKDLLVKVAKSHGFRLDVIESK